MFLIHMERKKGVRASGVLFGYWMLCFLLPITSTAQLVLQGVSGGLGGEPRCPFQALGPILPPPLFTHDLVSTQRHTKGDSLAQVYPSSHTSFMDTDSHVLHAHVTHFICTPDTHLYAPLNALPKHRLRHTHVHMAAHTCHQPVCLCLQAPTPLRYM